MEQATEAGTLTIADEGVRVFLQGANENDAAAHHLERMFFARKRRDTPEAEALNTGWHCARREAERCVEHLRNRGGLLHFRHAQVDYAYGAYTVRGAQ